MGCTVYFNSLAFWFRIQRSFCLFLNAKNPRISVQFFFYIYWISGPGIIKLSITNTNNTKSKIQSQYHFLDTLHSPLELKLYLFSQSIYKGTLTLTSLRTSITWLYLVYFKKQTNKKTRIGICFFPLVLIQILPR